MTRITRINTNIFFRGESLAIKINTSLEEHVHELETFGLNYDTNVRWPSDEPFHPKTTLLYLKDLSPKLAMIPRFNPEARR